ncbi:hypothetical protein AB0K02_04250 [Streptomyces sp. NPDC049597]|uniref:hypothetical protein n=1 Tax=Streptomyces sp. NPDC049597 TaxID=3155276 RepID=UPI003419B299
MDVDVGSGDPAFRDEARHTRWTALCTPGGPPATAGPGPRATGGACELRDHRRPFLLDPDAIVCCGPDEIRRTVVAERVLGLPEEPRR